MNHCTFKRSYNLLFILLRSKNSPKWDLLNCDHSSSLNVKPNTLRRSLGSKLFLPMMGTSIWLSSENWMSFLHWWWLLQLEEVFKGSWRSELGSTRRSPRSSTLIIFSWWIEFSIENGMLRIPLFDIHTRY